MIGAASEPSRAYRASGEIEFLLRSMRKSPRKIECCAVVGPKSQGDTAFSPSGLLIWPDCKRNRDDPYRAAFRFVFGSSRSRVFDRFRCCAGTNPLPDYLLII